MVYTHTQTQTHTQEYYSATKYNEVIPFVEHGWTKRLSY